MEASSHATMPSDDEQQRFRELIADFYQAAVRRAGEDSANAVIEHLIEEKLRKWSLSALPEDLRGQIESDKGEILRHEMNRHHLSEDEKARNRSDLIRLWSGAGASRIYDKKAWTNIEAQLLDADLI